MARPRLSVLGKMQVKANSGRACSQYRQRVLCVLFFSGIMKSISVPKVGIHFCLVANRVFPRTLDSSPVIAR